MWRSRAVYKCPSCGFIRKTERMIYKFDADDMHWDAYAGSPDMIDASRAAQEQPCPKCKQTNFFDFHTWED